MDVINPRGWRVSGYKITTEELGGGILGTGMIGSAGEVSERSLALDSAVVQSAYDVRYSLQEQEP